MVKYYEFNLKLISNIDIIFIKSNSLKNFFDNSINFYKGLLEISHFVTAPYKNPTLIKCGNYFIIGSFSI